MVDQPVGFFLTAFVLVFGQNGHERLRKCAFGKHPAQQVGQAEGNEERVGFHAGSKGAGNHEVAHETEYSRQQGHAADGGEGAQKIHRSHREAGKKNAKRVHFSGLLRDAAMRFACRMCAIACPAGEF